MVIKMMIAAAAAMAARTIPALPRAKALQGSRHSASVSAHSSVALVMKAAPIHAEWILEGEPQARLAEQSRSDDRAAYTAVWDCTAGRFRWYFGWDETVYILEGGVTVTSADGSIHDLRAGDIAYFKANTWATWQVDAYVRKVAFLRRPFPWPVAIAYRIKKKLFPAKAIVSQGVV